MVFAAYPPSQVVQQQQQQRDFRFVALGLLLVSIQLTSTASASVERPGLLAPAGLSVPDYSEMPDHDIELLIDFESPDNCFDLLHNTSGVGGGHAGQSGADSEYSCRIRQDGDQGTFGEWEISFWLRGDVAKAGNAPSAAVLRTDLHFISGVFSMSHNMSLPSGEWVAHMNTDAVAGEPRLGLGEWQWVSFTISSPHLYQRQHMPVKISGRPLNTALPANVGGPITTMLSANGEDFLAGLSRVTFVPLGAGFSIDNVLIRGKNRYFRAEQIAGGTAGDPPAIGPPGLNCAFSPPQVGALVPGRFGNTSAISMDLVSHATPASAVCTVATPPPERLLSSWVLEFDASWLDAPEPRSSAGSIYKPALKVIVTFGGGSHGFPEYDVALNLMWNMETGVLMGISNSSAGRPHALFEASATPFMGKGNTTRFWVDFAPSTWGMSHLDNVGVAVANHHAQDGLGDPLAMVASTLVLDASNPAGARLMPSVVALEFVALEEFYVVVDEVRLVQRGVVEFGPPTSSAAPTTTPEPTVPWTVGLQLKDDNSAVEFGDGPSAVHLYNDNGTLATDAADLVVRGQGIGQLVDRLDAMDAMLQSIAQRLDALEAA